MNKLIKLTILILLFNYNSFSQVNNLTFQFLRNVVDKGDTIALIDNLSKNKIPFHSSTFSNGKLIGDTGAVASLSIKEYFSKNKPYIQYSHFEGSSYESRRICFLFDIQYLPYYLKEGLKTVNKNKIRTHMWAYNDDKELNEEHTVLHFYPSKSQNEPDRKSEIIICRDKVLLYITYYHYFKKAK